MQTLQSNLGISNSWTPSSSLDLTWRDRASGQGFKDGNIKRQVKKLAVAIAAMIAAEFLERARYVSITK